MSEQGIATDTISICTAVATDAAVNKASAILTATIVAPDLTPPMVSFDPEDITLESGETAESVLEVLIEFYAVRALQQIIEHRRCDLCGHKSLLYDSSIFDECRRSSFANIEAFH